MDIRLYPPDLETGTWFDIAATDGTIDTDSTLDTAIELSLFCDRRSTMPQDQRSGGWWGDSLAEKAGDQWGSLLWLLDTSNPTAETARLARGYCEEALAWIIEDGIASEVNVTTEVQKPQTAGESARLAIAIEIVRPNGGKDKFDYVWPATEVRNGVYTP